MVHPIYENSKCLLGESLSLYTEYGELIGIGCIIEATTNNLNGLVSVKFKVDPLSGLTGPILRPFREPEKVTATTRNGTLRSQNMELDTVWPSAPLTINPAIIEALEASGHHMIVGRTKFQLQPIAHYIETGYGDFVQPVLTTKDMKVLSDARHGKRFLMKLVGLTRCSFGSGNEHGIMEPTYVKSGGTVEAAFAKNLPWEKTIGCDYVLQLIPNNNNRSSQVLVITDIGYAYFGFTRHKLCVVETLCGRRFFTRTENHIENAPGIPHISGYDTIRPASPRETAMFLVEERRMLDRDRLSRPKQKTEPQTAF